MAHTKMTPINSHADISSEARGLSFGLSLDLHPFFMYAYSQDADKSTKILMGERFQDYF